MANDLELYSLYALCEGRSRFVYEVVPGFYPGIGLSVIELEYWQCYNIITQAKFHDVPSNARTLEDVIASIKEAERKRKQKHVGAKKSPIK